MNTSGAFLLVLTRLRVPIRGLWAVRLRSSVRTAAADNSQLAIRKWGLRVDFSKLQGLIPAVIQDDTTDEVLMVGFMNEEALQRTRSSGYATFFSRTRNTLWMKGETSGNRLKVTQMLVDCDDDTVLLKVTCEGDGNACHTGARSCFRNDERIADDTSSADL